MPIASAHNVNVKGYTDKDSQYISNCNNKYYGYHKQNGQNHWHEVTFENDQWTIVNSKKILDSDPCLDNNKINASLVKCVDGDTAVFKIAGEEIKFRFLAVDTPESVHPTKEVEAYAKEASKNTCDLLTNANSILIEYDNNSDKTDKYGRNLAWIWIDDMLLQKLMIGEGFARVAYVYGDYKYLQDLCDLQFQAIAGNKGIWQYGYEVGYCSNSKTNNNGVTSNNIYKVTFDNDSDITTVSVAKGMNVKQPEIPNKIGYKFLGWYRDNEKYDFNTPINSNITLNAKYQLDYLYIILIVLVLAFGMFKSIKGDKNGKSHKKSTKLNRKKRI